MRKLSVALITRNEEKVVGRCLESLKWADEIVVLDGYSTDHTVEICKVYTDKIYQKVFESFPKERDYILKKTSFEWVLSVDADMYFPPAICEEIKDMLHRPEVYDAYLLKGLTIFLGHEVRHCGWFDHRYLRLFDKTKGRYDFSLTCIDPFIVKGRIGKLENHFIHHGGDSFADYFGKIKRYSALTADEYRHKGVRIGAFNWPWYLLIKPFLVFFYKYVVKRGVLDGVVGLLVCVNSAISYYTSYAILWDEQRKRKQEKERM
jgi:glycosyltransferase involved in cell wall biosynthesis